MLQSGIVISHQSQLAQVRIVRHSACAECGQCDLGREPRSIIVTARNPLAAQAGDRVMLSMSKNTLLQAGLLAYTLPLGAMFMAAFAGHFIAGQTGSLLGAFAALAGSYLWLNRFLEPRLAKSGQFSMTIVQVMDEEDDSCV